MFVCREQSEMTRIKTSVVHSDGNYILNTYSVHNYQEIYLVVPIGLCTVVHHVSDHKDVQRTAAAQIQDKKAGTRNPTSAPPNGALCGAPPPAFE